MSSAASVSCSEEATEALVQYLRHHRWRPKSPLDLLPFLQNGADIVGYEVPEVYRSILHEFIFRGDADVLRVLLEHATAPLDFTVGDEDTRRVFTVGGEGYDYKPPLLYLCDYEHCPHDRAAAVLALIVARLASHPNDIIRWDQKDKGYGKNFDFISSAAFHQRLSLFWPIVSRLPYFANHKQPIELCTTRVWRWDWEALGEAGQKRFRLPSGANVNDKDHSVLLSIPKPTAELYQLAMETYPNPSLVRSAIESGGQVLFQFPTGMYQPVLLEFISKGHYDCLKEVFTHPPTALDHTVCDGAKRTALHLLCEYKNLPAEQAKTILGLLLDHHIKYNDTIQWEKEDGWGHNFLSRAAHYQRLSLFWGVLEEKNISHFLSAPAKSLRVSSRVWAWDWAALSPAAQAQCVLSKPPPLEVLPVATAHLLRLCEESKWDPSPEEVRALVQDGANVGYADSEMEISLLHDLVKRARVAAVEAALTTPPRQASLPGPTPLPLPLSIDFTQGKIDSMTGNAVSGICRESLLLVYLCDYHILEAATAMLKAIVWRMKRYPMLDVVDWAQCIYDGRDFISAAAECGRLAVFWPIVSSLPYFEEKKQKGEKIPIKKPANKEDWDALGAEEQGWFELQKGFAEKKQ